MNGSATLIASVYRFLKQGFSSKVSQARFLKQGFSSKVSQARFLKQGPSSERFQDSGGRRRAPDATHVYSFRSAIQTGQRGVGAAVDSDSPRAERRGKMGEAGIEAHSEIGFLKEIRKLCERHPGGDRCLAHLPPH